MTDLPVSSVAVPGVYRAGRGEPLLLLHGIGMSWHAWEPVLPLLARDREVLAPTLPGHTGGPPAPSGPLGVASLADALCAWLDGLGLAAVDIAGNSLGGWLALELARRGRARSVVGLSPAGAWTAPRDMRRLAAAIRIGGALAARPAARRALRSPSLRRIALGRIVARPDLVAPAQADRLVTDIAGCPVLGELVDSAIRTGPLVPLPRGGCPVTLAWALHDRVIPWRRYGRPMLDALPDVHVVAMPGVGHVPMSDDPDLVATTILQAARLSA